MSNTASNTNDIMDQAEGENNAPEEVKLGHPEWQFPDEMTSGGQASDTIAIAEGNVIVKEKSIQNANMMEETSGCQALDAAVTAERKGKRKEESVQNLNETEVTRSDQGSDTAMTVEGKGIGKEDSVQNANPTDLASEEYTGGHATQVTAEQMDVQSPTKYQHASGSQASNLTATSEEKGKGREEFVQTTDATNPASNEHAGDFAMQVSLEQANIQEHVGSQDAIAELSSEMPPPPIPLPHNSSSETASITASSISNPTLEVDAGDGVRCRRFSLLDNNETEKLIFKQFDDDDLPFSDTDSAIMDNRQ